MKTSRLNPGQICLLLFFLFSVSACNKEEFYEKDFLVTPIDNSQTNGGANGSSAGGSDGNSQGGTTGGSSTGGTDGTTQGGTTGGSTTGGTDGQTTGSSTGSSTGGTTGDTSGGGSTGGIGGTTVEENFTQTSSSSKKLDIVWIIDNSGSMADEQEDLGYNFEIFINQFIVKNVDFKMGITTTDTRLAYKGLMVSGADTKLTSLAAKSNKYQFLSDFQNLVQVGTSGSGNEKGLEASEGFMQRYATSFLRKEAYLAIVIISDEEDQSSKTVSTYTNYLKSFKNEPGLVKIYSIVDVNNTNSGYGVTVGADRYKLASAQTAGVVGDIRDDFYNLLGDMGDAIINLLDSFALASKPLSGSLKVYVNGIVTTNYTFDPISLSIKFNPGSVPAAGSLIKVTYLK
jgi:hypothetical protein